MLDLAHLGGFLYFKILSLGYLNRDNDSILGSVK